MGQLIQQAVCLYSSAPTCQLEAPLLEYWSVLVKFLEGSPTMPTDILKRLVLRINFLSLFHSNTTCPTLVVPRRAFHEAISVYAKTINVLFSDITYDTVLVVIG